MVSNSFKSFPQDILFYVSLLLHSLGYHPKYSRLSRFKDYYLLPPTEHDGNTRKPGQVRFSHTQSTELERVFNNQKYILPQERKPLARTLGLSERQVKTWFQNRRAKYRKKENTKKGPGRPAHNAHPQTCRSFIHLPFKLFPPYSQLKLKIY